LGHKGFGAPPRKTHTRGVENAAKNRGTPPDVKNEDARKKSPTSFKTQGGKIPKWGNQESPSPTKVVEKRGTPVKNQT